MTCPASVPEARQPSKLQDEVQFLGGVLDWCECPRSVAEARDFAKVVDQVRLLAGTLVLRSE